MAEKQDEVLKESDDYVQQIITPLQFGPLTPKVTNRNVYKITSEPPKSPKPLRHRRRHRSLTVTSFDHEESCPYSPNSLDGNAEHSVSLVSRQSNIEKSIPEPRSTLRSRKRDRFYRLLPLLLLRRQSRKKKKIAKVSDDGESGFSDNDVSRASSRNPSISPRRQPLHQAYESLTLGRVNYMKRGDFAKLQRTPLLNSSSALLTSSTNGENTPTAGSTLRVRKHREKELEAALMLSSTPSTPLPPPQPLLYSVACQNGVCVSSKMVEVGRPMIEESQIQTFGKKMQVGQSFINQAYDLEMAYSLERSGRQMVASIGNEDGREEEEEAGMVEEVDFNQSSHVYANINPQRIYTLEHAMSGPVLYDIGIQADLPNRLRGLRCRLEFEQPGVELGNRGQLSCEAFKEGFDSFNLGDIDGRLNGRGKSVDGRDSKTLSFRVAFNNKPARSASTI